ncbi:MAG: polyprenyl synthetase family protein, partial [Actinomycetota bacterium]
GIVGETSLTGKPVGDDIREGKRTVPLWHAWTAADAAGRAVLAAAVGNASASESLIADAIGVVVDSGAVGAVEKEIAELGARASALISGLDVDDAGRIALADLLRQWGVRVA